MKKRLGFADPESIRSWKGGRWFSAKDAPDALAFARERSSIARMIRSGADSGCEYGWFPDIAASENPPVPKMHGAFYGG